MSQIILFGIHKEWTINPLFYLHTRAVVSDTACTDFQCFIQLLAVVLYQLYFFFAVQKPPYGVYAFMLCKSEWNVST